MSNNQVNIGGGGGAGGSGSGASSGGSNSQAPTQQTLPVVGVSNSSGLKIPSTDGSNIAADNSPRESGDDSEDESEILEESPCGRWLKRREEVDQRDVPGIDCVHLAMDTEEGVEVVWNEVQYANLQELKSQEDKMRQVFDNLLLLDHQNIVKFHRYWTDTTNSDRPRVIFITEYMSSGSLKQFLKRTKRNAKRLPLEAWRRWCTQILSALNYLHSCTPPVIHGNLTCDSIFIQHNGLVKIGSVVPDAVHYSVRQHKAEFVDHGSQYFIAPEYGAAEQLTAAADIYAFGMCALEMAALEIQPTSGTEVTDSIDDETILRTINSLEHDLQRDLIFKCLRRNPAERPSASDLLFHPLLFEVHSLKLLSAHCLVFSPRNRTNFSETVVDAMMQRYNRPDVIMARITQSGDSREYRLADVPTADKLEKFVEDVKYGVYPLTALGGKKPPHFRSRAASPVRADSIKSVTPEPIDIESRRIVNMMCSVKKLREDSRDISMTILLRMDDKMNRQLTCQVTEEDTAVDLTNELVRLGFVHIEDKEKIEILLEETLSGSFGLGDQEQDVEPLPYNTIMSEPTNVEPDTDATSRTDIAEAAASELNQLDRSWSVAETNATVPIEQNIPVEHNISTPVPQEQLILDFTLRQQDRLLEEQQIEQHQLELLQEIQQTQLDMLPKLDPLLGTSTTTSSPSATATINK
ncbi:nuclear receptor-binding protein homolog [Teleopsis dalmanni]|uniref:nuclear receptor-binding protein homolog n=1 Tax=Teleopsis dalmanni TaxID=139649 RepID=UPI0018CE6C7E|nr:nuclear receptor-binding protein homolog [Teleopsis dalmanni]